jgi:hypothetical protein
MQRIVFNNRDANLVSFWHQLCRHRDKCMLLKSARWQRIKPFQSVSSHSYPARHRCICFETVCSDGFEAIGSLPNKAFEGEQGVDLSNMITTRYDMKKATDVRLRLPRRSGCKPL